MNFLNNMMGVVAPVTTGYIVGATGSFAGAFLAAGIVLVIGIVAYVFILGPAGADRGSAGRVRRRRVNFHCGGWPAARNVTSAVHSAYMLRL
jgi:hypothetical protein